jgi:branched-subunit amino acid ABC-type transport system permease component
VAILISAAFVGLMLGCVYALMAFGIVASYRISRVVNLGVAGIGAWTAGVYWWMADRWGAPLFVSLIIAVLIGTAMGAALGFMVLRMKAWPQGLIMIITLAITLLLFYSVDVQWLHSWCATACSVPSPFGDGGFTIFYAVINWADLGTFFTCVAVAGVLTFLMRRTRFGLFSRAIYDDPPGAATLGIPFNFAVVGVWALSGTLAALGGVLVSHRTLLQPELLLFVAVWGLAGATLGGLESFLLAFFGGLSIGLAEGIIGGDLGTSLPPGVENLGAVSVMGLAVMYAGWKRRGKITEVTA